MLGESEAITERSQWKKIKVLFEKDTRYRAVEGSAQREEWFNEFVVGLSNRSNADQKRRERIQARWGGWVWCVHKVRECTCI